MRNARILFIAFFFFLSWQSCQPGPPSPSEIRIHSGFSSVYVEPHSLEIYLPEGYSSSRRKHFPVVYLHDGQYLFYGDSLNWSNAWGIDSIMDTLVSAKRILPAIIVGISSTERRFLEFMPQKGVEQFPDSTKEKFSRVYNTTESDQYLRFIVEEVKPFVDSVYRTKPGSLHTFIAGSTMAGLISLYAITEYPDIFGGAACIATQWTLAPQDIHPDAARAMVDVLGRNLPDPANHRIYFDYWAENEASIFEPYQKRMDEHMVSRGYIQPGNWKTLEFETTAITLGGWRRELHHPLEFLLETGD